MKGKKLLSAIIAGAMILGMTVMPAFADAEKGTKANPYTFEEFNALKDVSGQELWVNVNLDISEKSTTIGNYDMSDGYVWVYDGKAAPEGYVKTGRRTAQENATAYVSTKAGATIHIMGTLKSETGYNNSNFVDFKSLYFQLPSASKIILEGMTLNGIFCITTSYTYLYNWPDGSLADGNGTVKADWDTNIWYGFPIMSDNLILDNCTVNGQWLANGPENGAMAKNITITNTIFNHHINLLNGNNSNPIWWKGQKQMENLTIKNCKIKSSRPIKIGEGGLTGNINITDNTFTMLDGNACGTTSESDSKKNAALYIDTAGVGNIDISNNTLYTAEGVHTQLLAYKGIKTKDDATVKIAQNKKADGTALTAEETINGWHTDGVWSDEIKSFVCDKVSGIEVKADAKVKNETKAYKKVSETDVATGFVSTITPAENSTLAVKKIYWTVTSDGETRRTKVFDLPQIEAQGTAQIGLVISGLYDENATAVASVLSAN